MKLLTQLIRFSQTQPSALFRLGTCMQRSKGNMLVGMDGKQYLDLHCNIASLTLGYNHPRIVQKASETLHLAAQRPAINLYPPEEHIKQLETLYPRINPFGKDPYYLWLGQGGAEAIEAAIRTLYRHRYRTLYPDENTLMADCPVRNLKVLSLHGGYHGRSLGALSLTRSNDQHKLGFPSFPFVHAPFPTDCSTLENFELTLARHHQDLVGLVMEPIQSEGGHVHMMDGAYDRIMHLCKYYSIPVVADCVQTALGTGDHWGYEHMGEMVPDIVVGSKKLQLPIMFAKEYLRVPEQDSYSMNSTWAGCAFRAGLLEECLDVIDEESLYRKSLQVGAWIQEEIAKIPGIKRVRGRGTFMAFSVNDPQMVIKGLEDNGILVGGCGNDSIRLRPTLTLTRKEAEMFVDRLNKVMKE